MDKAKAGELFAKNHWAPACSGGSFASMSRRACGQPCCAAVSFPSRASVSAIASASRSTARAPGGSDAVLTLTRLMTRSGATEEFAKLIKAYGIRRVTGDRYAGQWCAQAFQKRGITYTPSELPKSGLYTDLLPKLMANQIRLVDNTRLVNQLASLERRTARGGKDSIDHPPSGKDDVANVVAGLASIAAAPRNTVTIEQLRI
jgi:hypothetical protein